MKLSLEKKKLVLEWSAGGMSSEAIAERLETEHGIEISSGAIRETVRKVRSERQEMVQTAARVHLGEHVMSDLDALQEVADMASDIARRTYKMGIQHASEGTIHAEVAELCLKAIDRVDKIRCTRLKFAGVDQPGGAPSQLSEPDVSRLEPGEVRIHFRLLAKAARTEAERARYEAVAAAMAPQQEGEQ